MILMKKSHLCLHNFEIYFLEFLKKTVLGVISGKVYFYLKLLEKKDLNILDIILVQDFSPLITEIARSLKNFHLDD